MGKYASPDYDQLRAARKVRAKQIEEIQHLLKRAGRCIKSRHDTIGARVAPPPAPRHLPFKLFQLVGEPFDGTDFQRTNWASYVLNHHINSVWLGCDGKLYTVNPVLATKPRYGIRRYIMIPIKQYADRDPETVLEKLKELLGP